MKNKKNIKTISLIGLMAVSAMPLFAENCPKVEAVLSAYVDNSVVAGYVALSDNAIAMDKAIQALVEDTTDENSVKAANAWLKARKSLESGEAYLYGPANFAGIDPNLDSWPVDTDQVASLLKAVSKGILELDADYVRGSLGANLRGYHTLGYLLFRDGKARPANSFTKAELAYLSAASTVATEDSILYLSWWNSMDNLPQEKLAYLEDAELESAGNYGFELKNAGKAGSRYLSQADALEEIMTACVGIAEELGAAKFGDPFNDQDPMLFESWYSLTSLEDCKDNAMSIVNAYNGVNACENSVSALVAAKDAKVDAKVQSSFVALFKAMNAFDAPLAKSLDNKAAFEAVISASEELAEALVAAQEVLLSK